MPQPRKVDQLDQETRAELDRRIIANGFGGYVALSEWLAENGYEIGKSALGVHGQGLERRMAQIKAATEAAKLITDQSPDDADERSNAIMGMIQADIFDTLVAMQEAEGLTDPAERIGVLSKAAKNIATLTRASVTRNKWAMEVREKVAAAADAIEEEGREQGWTEQQIKRGREIVTGIIKG